ncbi:hypothetical protein KY335_06040 [Candidatus Woesearchaeota archaeon]|nr:hypothetical protein [Candidatus Woesearchaeota archaeon]
MEIQRKKLEEIVLRARSGESFVLNIGILPTGEFDEELKGDIVQMSVSVYDGNIEYFRGTYLGKKKDLSNELWRLRLQVMGKLREENIKCKYADKAIFVNHDFEEKPDDGKPIEMRRSDFLKMTYNTVQVCSALGGRYNEVYLHKQYPMRPLLLSHREISSLGTRAGMSQEEIDENCAKVHNIKVIPDETLVQGTLFDLS